MILANILNFLTILEAKLSSFCRAHKKLSSVVAWENSKKASVEAELKKIEVSKHSIYTN